MNQTLHVRIISPQKLIFETKAESVSSKNSQGNFDILFNHANFITLIENSALIVRVDKQKIMTFNFPLGIVFASSNKVNIYTNIQYQPS